MAWNTHAAISVGAEETTVEYVIDLAEVPSLRVTEELQGATLEAWAEPACQDAASGLSIRVAGRELALAASLREAKHLPGEGGLQTTRVECELTAPNTEFGTLTYLDTNYLDTVGWREVTLVGDGVVIESSEFPVSSKSQVLQQYPNRKPLRVLSGTAETRGIGESGSESIPDGVGENVAPAGDANERGLKDVLSDAIRSESLSFSMMLLALGVALTLGAFHSLAPGHGKSVMAALVAGRRGTMRDVLTVAGVVAFTHTAGVLLLGVALWSSDSFAPEAALPWLTAASGLMLMLMGVLLARRVITGRGWGGHSHHGHEHGHDHAHGHGHGHGHGHDNDHDHDHDHGHDHGHDHDHGHRDEPELAERLSLRWLVGMGVAGGVVPTPSALVVLLGANAVGRVWFGVLLVAMYGVGMAVTLTGAGYIFVRLERRFEKVLFSKPWWGTFLRYAPLGTALVLAGSGGLITLSAI